MIIRPCENGVMAGGAVFVYTLNREDGTWSNAVRLVAPTVENGAFGISISLVQDDDNAAMRRLAIGGPGTNEAHVWVQCPVLVATDGETAERETPAPTSTTTSISDAAPTMAPSVVDAATTTAPSVGTPLSTTAPSVGTPSKTAAPSDGLTAPTTMAPTEPVHPLCVDPAVGGAWVPEGRITATLDQIEQDGGTEESSTTTTTTTTTFGTSVVLNQDVVIVADPLAASNLVDQAGQAFGYTLVNLEEVQPQDEDIYTGPSSSSDLMNRWWSPYSGRNALDASDPTSGSNFGISVAKAGNLIIVGAPFVASEDGTMQQAGAVYVFTQLQNRYRQQAKLVSPYPFAMTRFGWSVDTDGSSIIVGTLIESGRGEVYIFGPGETQNAWVPELALSGEDGVDADLFGIAVSVDQGTAVVGQAVSSTLYGAAYVLDRQVNGTWVVEAILESMESSELGGFGASVAIDADTIVVGAVDDDTDQPKGGAAYVFERTWSDDESSSSTWTPQARLVPPEPARSNEFGSYVAVHGETIVASNWQYQTDGLEQAGAAFVYERQQPDGTWSDEPVVLTSLDPIEMESFGVSVSVEGNRMVVGASGTHSAMTYYKCPPAVVVVQETPSVSTPSVSTPVAAPVSEPSVSTPVAAPVSIPSVAVDTEVPPSFAIADDARQRIPTAPLPPSSSAATRFGIYGIDHVLLVCAILVTSTLWMLRA